MKKILVLFVLVLTGYGLKAQDLNTSIIPAEYKSICDYQNFLKHSNRNSSDSILKANLYFELLGVVIELAQYRQEFLKKGNLINLFPTSYFHTTAKEMVNIRSNLYDYPIEKMQQMVAFYEAYKCNRSLYEAGHTEKIEKHWGREFIDSNKDKSYFGITGTPSIDQEAQVIFYFSFTLKGAINAHVDIDLPRAIRFSYQQRNTPDIVGLKTDFDKTNPIFINTRDRTIDDLRLAYSINKLFTDLIDAITILDPDVISKRTTAWEKAFNNSVLDTHPICLNHRELLEKGRNVCSFSEACPIPNNLNTSNITSSSATLSWGIIPSATAYRLEYRMKGNTAWIGQSITSNVTTINNLTSNQIYEFRVGSVCSISQSEYSQVFEFLTPVCGKPQNLSIVSQNESSIVLKWDEVDGATSYSLEWRYKNSQDNSFYLGDECNRNFFNYRYIKSTRFWDMYNKPNTEKEYRVRATCNTKLGDYSNIIVGKTNSLQNCSNVFEPNNDPLTATNISLNQFVSSRIDEDDRIDYFKMNFTLGAKYSIYSTIGVDVENDNGFLDGTKCLRGRSHGSALLIPGLFTGQHWFQIDNALLHATNLQPRQAHQIPHY